MSKNHQVLVHKLQVTVASHVNVTRRVEPPPHTESGHGAEESAVLSHGSPVLVANEDYLLRMHECCAA